MTHPKNKHRIYRFAEDAPPIKLVRANDHPFCGYFGPQGQTCSATANLAQVLCIKGTPDLVWLACPQHRAELEQVAQAFQQRLQRFAENLTLNHHDFLERIRVGPTMKLHD